MKHLAIGLMSGTSADGVSAALARFGDDSLELLDHLTQPYPSRLSDRILRAREAPAAEIAALNFALGEIFASATLRILKKNRIPCARVAVIGSHGQTLFHGPKNRPPCTLQVGEAACIAARTGITTVSDFRAADVAAGGEGAPLLPYFDRHFFGRGPLRALQNIGGIANASIVGAGLGKPLAFDQGPGNCLMDWAVQKLTGGKSRFDKDGALARNGRILMPLVKDMMRHPFFARRPPKSTGRELFNEDFLPAGMKSALRKRPPDALNTLAYFTAFAIADSYKRFIPAKHKLQEVVVSGGGARNPALMKHLQSLIYPVPLRSMESLGLPLQAKEPAAFAFFALRALQGRPNHAPWGTGAKSSLILGKITPGKNFRGAL